MEKKIIKLNEQDVERLVKKIIKEDNSMSELESERKKHLDLTKEYREEYGDEYIDQLEQLTDPIEFFRFVKEVEGLSSYDLPHVVNDVLGDDEFK